MKETFSEIIKSDQKVLVDFYADWCGPCKMMSPILKEFKEITEDVRVIKIDVDRNPKAAAKFQVRGVPTLILFQNGQIKWRQSGVVNAQQLKQVVESV